jgi:two-component system, NarL family, nitrate/nitrite response regulator NarL
MTGTGAIRVRLHGTDPVRRTGLTATLHAMGHVVADDAPDAVLVDLPIGGPLLLESEAPIVVLTDHAPAGDPPAGLLLRDATAAQLDLALRAVVIGLQVRMPGLLASEPGFHAATDSLPPSLTPRETEILTLIGEGLSNKGVARQLEISVHTVKFHLEALFAKLDATSRAEAVAKGLRGGVIEL